MAPPTAQELFNRNVEYKDTHPPIPSFEELYASGDQAATVAVITCADPRCIPENFLKLNVGEAVILRNAGSNIHEAMRSLIAIDCLIGLKEIMVVNHTDCGATVFRNDSIRTVLKERVPGKNEEVDAMKFGEITTYGYFCCVPHALRLTFMQFARRYSTSKHKIPEGIAVPAPRIEGWHNWLCLRLEKRIFATHRVNGGEKINKVLE